VVAAIGAAATLGRGSFASAVSISMRERPVPIVLAAVCVLLVPHAHTAAWRRVLSALGHRLAHLDAWPCYGAGCLVNTLLPAKLGEPVRIELFARRIASSSPRLQACAASAGVGLGQAGAMLALLAVGAIAGLLPLWAAAPAVGLPLLAATVRLAGLRCASYARARRLAQAASLAATAWRGLVGWIGVAACLRVAAVAGVLDAASAPHPLANAVIALSAGALGGALPIAPGGVGLPAAAMAVALAHHGLGEGAAIAAAVTFHVLETAASLVFAATGYVLAKGRRHSRAWAATSRPRERLVAALGLGVP
jgi:glycosyltransferase 2 family protein